MRLFFKYLKQKRRSVIACGVFALIFAVSFFLYCLPVEAVIYPALLCAVIGLFLLVFDYLRVKRKHEALTKIKTITDAMTANFPAIDGIQDADYHGSGPHGVRVSDGAEASGAFQFAECMAFRAGHRNCHRHFRRVLRRSIQDHVQRLLCHRQRKAAERIISGIAAGRRRICCACLFWANACGIRAPCAAEEGKNMRTPKSVRMFFVKERRFGESIYEETGVAVACLREFPLTSFPVTIGYFF